MEYFYTKRIKRLTQGLDKPEVVYDVRQLNRLIKLKGDGELRLKEEDLLVSSDYEYNRENYPDYFVQDEQKFSLEYKFQPGEEDDGVTLHIPRNRLSQIDPAEVPTMVPGRNRELVTSLIKSLPKEKRKKLIPVNAHVDEIMKQLDSRSQALLIEQLSSVIYKTWNVVIHASDWDEEKIPDHLKIRYALEDKRGKIIKASRDRAILFEKVEEPVIPEAKLKKVRIGWERHALKDWKGLDLPEKINEKSRGQTIVLYPVLKKAGKDVDLRLVQDKMEAGNIHRTGTAALFRRYYLKEEKSFSKSLGLSKRFPREVLYLGGGEKLEDFLWDRIFMDLFGVDNCRKENDFERLRKEKGALVYETAENYGEKLIRFLDSYSQCRQCLKKNRELGKKGREQFLEDRETDLSILVPEDFVIVYDPAKWSDLVRYMRALVQRIEKGMIDPLTDRKRDEEWHAYFDLYEQLKSGLSVHATGVKLDALEELYWMIQEYGVALFGGGTVKTGMKVSPKRLDEKISLVRSLV